eukprot:TRINITY_DN4026_c0_g1_i1.p1 TRINITY_DN4026_c0_g1~~TRINITY_DN4026_c0_g1_i1.p1  ORF type:complete len:505 (-),score=55.99 TRINITY_DN4026_c0_g1_i1:1209-2723(-)
MFSQREQLTESVMTSDLSGSDSPRCAVCDEVLGKYGGPATLPCGHNGCVHCFASLQQSNEYPECPLCGTSFPRDLNIVCNKDLRNLVKSSQRWKYGGLVEGDWVATPNLHTTNKQYAQEISQSSASSSDGSYHKNRQLTLQGCDGLSLRGDLLNMDPPPWVPDSQCKKCQICQMEFVPFFRGRHHCRLCGWIFCSSCCHKRMLLPPKFGLTEPQRTCQLCAGVLQPIQGQLAQYLSRSGKSPVFDVTDATSLRSWINAPIGNSMEADLYKASNILNTFSDAASMLQAERKIPPVLIQGAVGLIILSTFKIGALGIAGTAGTGVIVSKRSDGTWSPPAALWLGGVGWGLQFGGELSDLLIVIKSKQALNSFCGKVQLGVNGSVSCALGPVGREAFAMATVGDGGHAACYSYSFSRGVYVGISITGVTLSIRDDINHKFYGLEYTAKQLLLEENIPQPPAAQMFYSAISDFLYATTGQQSAKRFSGQYCSKDLQFPDEDDDFPVGD